MRVSDRLRQSRECGQFWLELDSFGGNATYFGNVHTPDDDGSEVAVVVCSQTYTGESVAVGIALRKVNSDSAASVRRVWRSRTGIRPSLPSAELDTGRCLGNVLSPLVALAQSSCISSAQPEDSASG
ncbi:hypothetical protein BaRGS_00028934 [Batillaria attramentaria]|uniref:Uncharacterized protein n=1 Tax=Batillaria attramentaria TaxID=370345 RepID=A0ABD0JXX8_9CAEN